MSLPWYSKFKSNAWQATYALTVVARAINHGAPSIYCFESLSVVLPNGTEVLAVSTLALLFALPAAAKSELYVETA
jgi:hypothetical protein